MKQRQYQAVIWDLDGTLLDTIEDLTDAVNHSMEAYGYPTYETLQIKQFVGNGVERLMERAVPDGKKDPRFEEIFAGFKQYYTGHCNEKTDLYAGIRELMLELKQQGIAQAIVSNKNQEAVTELAAIYFADLIEVAIGQQNAIAKKPAPDMVELALERLGCKREAAVYIGDSEVDVATAKNSKMDGIAVSWGFRSIEQLQAAGASKILTEVEELRKELLA